ncbi:AzlC family ABC transporter permease [Alkaliphilus peptidifermentans]|uniref:4-azaleucine resistance probable transporter AzlC n=1 Tax=Alkaliphilus peptidifermentans DSM 18978 TaxID=1120976 RepID=A0A1G5BS36_9FIRM|nr:AzlC family ABC transporter permease [Alkaliphilus peptidifermentans]SCX93045.1 4-azaleucine resistance probable transporter AzlC [Alkaliphilus peptidifermentans DSM 18978]
MKTFGFAVKQIIPLIFSYVFVGIAFGILIHEAGYSVLWAFLSGAFIYAGSMQIVMVSLMTSGVPLIMIGIMTFFINARHIFYGIGFVAKFSKMGWKYPYMVLTLTDETYSVFCSIKYPENMDEEKVDFYIALICHVLWIISCTIGALAGEMLFFDMKGIEFSATAFFVVVCVNQYYQFDSHIPVITGFVSAIVFYFLLGSDYFILPALSVSLIIHTIMKERIDIQMGGMNYDN